MSLREAVPDGASVLFDTNPLVYLLEDHPLAEPFVGLFGDVDSGRIEGVITPITLAEVLSGPLGAGHEALAERYRHALTSGGFRLRALDAEVAVLAARLRIAHRLKLPDAFQLAAALSEGCAALVTHDRDFRAVTALPILGLTPSRPPKRQPR